MVKMFLYFLQTCFRQNNTNAKQLWISSFYRSKNEPTRTSRQHVHHDTTSEYATHWHENYEIFPKLPANHTTKSSNIFRKYLCWFKKLNFLIFFSVDVTIKHEKDSLRKIWSFLRRRFDIHFKSTTNREIYSIIRSYNYYFEVL